MQTFVEHIHQVLAADLSLSSRVKEFSLDPEARSASHGPLLLVLPVASRFVRADEARTLFEFEALVEVRFHRFQGGEDPALLLAELEEDIRDILWDSRLPEQGVDFLDEAPLRVISSMYDFPEQDGRSGNPPYRLEMRLTGGKFASL